MTQRECRGCDAPGGWKNQPEPQLVDRREQVLDSLTAYQITSMLEGVVQGGTASIMREVGKPIAGKTGTTSDGKGRLVRRLFAGSRRRSLSWL